MGSLKAVIVGSALLVSSAASAQYYTPYAYVPVYPMPVAPACYSTTDGTLHPVGAIFCSGAANTVYRCMGNGTWATTREPICNGVPYGWLVP